MPSEGTAVERATAKASDAAAIQSCLENIESLNAFLTEKLEGDAPGFADLNRALKTAQSELEHVADS